jgi:anti-sigma factor RsiW
MKIDDAYEKLSEYLDGGLNPNERLEIERLIRSNSEFFHAFRIQQEIEDTLRGHTWIEPSQGFTWNVLGRAGMVHLKRVPLAVRAWEASKIWVSAAASILVIILHRELLVSWGSTVLSQVGNWLGEVTGSSFFELHPMVILSLFAPVLVGVFATYVLTSRSRMNR